MAKTGSLSWRAFQWFERREWRKPHGAFLLKPLLRRLAIPSGDVLATTANGLQLILNPRRERIIEASIYLTGSYEPNLLWLLSKVLRSGDVFVDIGCNIGHISLTAAKLVGGKGRVLAIEPVASTFQRMWRNVEANGVLNLIVENVALGDVEGEAEISIPESIGCGGASLLGRADAERSEVVTVRTLDELVAAHGITHCRMVKIDVEGYEPRVIAGGTEFFSNHGAEIICMEYSTMGGATWHPLRAVEQLIASGYVLYRSTEDKGSKRPSRLVPSPTTYLPEHDNIYFIAPEFVDTISVAESSGAD